MKFLCWTYLDSNELGGEKKKKLAVSVSINIYILYVSNTHYVLYDGRVL